MQPERRDPAYLWDMWEAARRVTEFVRGITAEQFLADEMRRSAVERQIIILGEAARRVSSLFKAAHPEIPWVRMIGLRNLVTHEYERVDFRTLWKVATESIPELVDLLGPWIPPPPESDAK